MGIGSFNYGGWGNWRNAICKLDNQESQWNNSVQRPKKWGAESGVELGFGAEDPRTRSSIVPCGRTGEMAERVRTHHSSTVCSVQALKVPDDALLHWGGPSALFNSRIQMLMSSGNNLANTPRNNAFQLSEHPLAQLNWHITLITTVVPLSSTLFYEYKNQSAGWLRYSLTSTKLVGSFDYYRLPFSTLPLSTFLVPWWCPVWSLWDTALASPQEQVFLDLATISGTPHVSLYL